MPIKFYVDWDSDGTFNDANEDITADVMRARWSLGARNPFQSVADEATLTMKIRNTTGKYSPENATSPLAGLIRPMKRVRVFETVTNTQLWNGWLDFPQLDWQTAGDYTGKTSMTLNAIGAKTLLDKITITQDLFTNVRADEVIFDAMEQAGIFPAIDSGWVLGNAGLGLLGETTILASNDAWRDFDEGLTVFPDYGGGREAVGALIGDLVNTERGQFWFDREGKAIFRNRHHTYTTTTTDYTLTDENLPTEIAYLYGDIFANSVTVTGRPRRIESSEMLWELDNPIEIAPRQTAIIEARLRRSNGQFASASSLTHTATFSTGSATISITPQGGVARVSIQNTGIGIAVVSSLVINGAPRYQQNELTATAQDNDSISQYYLRESQLSLTNVYEYQTLRDIGYMEILRLPMRGRVANFGMIALDDGVDNAVMIEDLFIGAFLVIDATATLYHSDRYMVIGEEHELEQGGVHTARYFTEPVKQWGWVLGTSALDSSAVLIF